MLDLLKRTAKLIHCLEQFGKHVGLAFQIADDLLDVTGDAAKLGKNVGKDATLGKMTYPALLGLDGSRRKADDLIHEACELLEPLGRKGATRFQNWRDLSQRETTERMQPFHSIRFSTTRFGLET